MEVMSDYSLSSRPVATLDAEARGDFVMRVYKYLLGAIGAFVAFEVALFVTGAAEAIFDFLVETGGMSWLLILGLVMVMQWIAARSASDLLNPQKQLVGLAVSAAAQSVIFAPLLYGIFNYSDDGTTTVGIAAVVTVIGFAVLTVVAFTTRKDLSVLRPLLMWGFGVALLLIVAALIFGWNLGVWFSVAMIGLAGVAILYDTQKVMATYPNNAHAAGALRLFSSVMLMFFYVLRLVSALRN
jgi:FtsH-binding integral membrane protein